MENRFYVYLHKKASNGDVFYVGKGCGKRAWRKTQRNNHWKNIESKHGRVVEITHRNLSEDEAFRIEVELIAKYGMHKLANACSGGMGGRVLSDEVKRKMSAARKGKKLSPELIEKIRIRSTGFRHSEETKQKLREINQGRKGHKHSEETKENLRQIMKARPILDEWKKKISEAKKGKPGVKKTPEQVEQIKQRMLGHEVSQDTRNKISLANKGRKHTAEAMEKIIRNNRALNEKRRKPVACSNGMIFCSARDATLWLQQNGYPSATKGNIVSCCTGRLKTAYGFKWSHVQDPEKESHQWQP